MAGIVEMEASLKACRILIMQQKYLEASYVLQNVVYINLQLSEDEKIERYSTLSQLYHQIGFYRKASFFKRVAAMQCIAQPNPAQGWQRCYNLLLQSLQGYKLPLDPRDLPKDRASGWAVVQMRVLHELIFSARKMGNPALAVRHLTFLVHAMLEHLEPQERREICVALESYTAKSEGTTTSITLDNGSVLPPVSLTKIPSVRSFKLSNLTPHMQPIKLQTQAQTHASQTGGSPFIYSPFLGASGSEQDKVAGPRMEFHWVEGEVCEVLLQVYNPLPLDLKVTNMGLISSGVELEVYPTNFTLPPESGPHPVKVMVVPKETGVLSISGYTSHVLGIRSNCLLRDLHCVDVDVLEVEVIPGLPQINLSTSLPQAASFGSLSQSPIVVTSASATLYAGQSCECVVTLTNKGKIPIEHLDVSLESKYRTDLIEEMFLWSCDSVHTQLPLQPQSQACFTVYIYGVSSFLNQDSQSLGSKYSLVSEITGNLNIEALLKFEYSGGPGQACNYWRQCAVSLSAEVIPSVVFTKWDILPTQSDEKSHLVFDLENVTSHEMGISHNTAFNVVLEADCCKRFCLPVVKCNAPASSSPGTQNLQSLIKEHLTGLVDIQWRMASTGGEGSVKMDHLTWKEGQLQVMLHSPIRWAVELNDQGYQPNSGVTFKTGCPVSVLVKLHNQSSHRLENSTLSLRCQPDEQENHYQNDLNDAVIFIGTNFTTIKTVEPDVCISHAVDLVFLKPGHYKLNSICCGTLNTVTDVETSDYSSISITESIDCQKQTWKCQPQICIQVYDSDEAT